MTDRWPCLLGLVCGDMISPPPHAAERHPMLQDVKDLFRAAGIEHVPAEEACKPSQPAVARSLGFGEWLIPPSAAMLIRLVTMAKIQDGIREALGRAVLCTGLYRPQAYNKAVGGKMPEGNKPGSAHMMLDHDGAEPAAIDLLFRDRTDCATAVQWARRLMAIGWIDVGIGEGDHKMHLDFFHGRSKWWPYESLRRDGQTRRDPP